MAVFSGPEVVNDGLVLYLDAANPRSYPGSGTTWSDLSGNNNNGTLVNGPTYSSANKGSFVLDGVNDYGDYSIANARAETIIVWAKSNTTNWNTDGWLSSSRTNNGHIIHPNANTKSVAFYIYNSTGAGFVQLGSVAITNITVPHMYALTTNGSNAHKAYVDGVLSLNNTSAITRTLTPGVTVTRFGADSIFTRFGSGVLYSTLRYNRELSQAEITQNFEAMRSRYSV